MRSRRSRCALAGALLLAAANVLVWPTHAQAQGAFTNNLVADIDQVTESLARAADRGRPTADVMHLRNALDQLLDVLETPGQNRGDGHARHDEHHSHLWAGLAQGHHDHHGDHQVPMDHADKNHQPTGVQNAAQSIGADAGRSTMSPKQARAKNAAGGNHNAPTVNTAGKTIDTGNAKRGPVVLAGAAEARRAPTLAPAVNQANQPGQFKQGAGPDAGNVQAKNGAGRRGNNLGMNTGGNNQAVGGPAGNPLGQNGDPNAPGRAKAGHHHHHHHDAGEARDGGANFNNQANRGQQAGNASNQVNRGQQAGNANNQANRGQQAGNANNQANRGQQAGNPGMCKQGNGPANNQGRAKSGYGGNTAGNLAQNTGNRGKANGQSTNRGTTNANANANGTQAYVNQLMNGNGNGNRVGQQNQRTTNTAQRSQGGYNPTGQQQYGNRMTMPTNQQHAQAAMMRSMQANWAMAHAHQQAGMSVGQRFGNQSMASRRR